MHVTFVEMVFVQHSFCVACGRRKFGSSQIAASVLGEMKVFDTGAKRNPFPTTKNLSTRAIDVSRAGRRVCGDSERMYRIVSQPVSATTADMQYLSQERRPATVSLGWSPSSHRFYAMACDNSSFSLSLW